MRMTQSNATTTTNEDKERNTRLFGGHLKGEEGGRRESNALGETLDGQEADGKENNRIEIDARKEGRGKNPEFQWPTQNTLHNENDANREE